jgi:hypothetical protein
VVKAEKKCVSLVTRLLNKKNIIIKYCISFCFIFNNFIVLDMFDWSRVFFFEAANDFIDKKE